MLAISMFAHQLFNELPMLVQVQWTLAVLLVMGVMYCRSKDLRRLRGTFRYLFQSIKAQALSTSTAVSAAGPCIHAACAAKIVTKMLPVLPQERIDAIACRRWKEVLAWIVFHPDELLWVDKKKQTVLHHACLFRAPAEVIGMMLYQAPELAAMANVDNEIPLHWAVRLSAPHEVIQCLLSAHPISACGVKDKDGNTALSLVWDRHGTDLLSLWWDADRNAITAHAGWKGILYFLQCYSLAFAIERVSNDDSAEQDDKDDDGKAATDTNEFFPLHAATLCPLCPTSMYPLFLQVYKDQLTVQDAWGRTPLAVACLDPMSNRSVGAFTKVHLLLAEDSSVASIPDHSGRLPLFTALASGVRWEEGIEDLIVISPHSMQLRDPVTQLPPFLLAASAGSKRTSGEDDDDPIAVSTTAPPQSQHGYDAEAKSLSTIFSLLRADPSQLKL